MLSMFRRGLSKTSCIKVAYVQRSYIAILVVGAARGNAPKANATTSEANERPNHKYYDQQCVGLRPTLCWCFADRRRPIRSSRAAVVAVVPRAESKGKRCHCSCKSPSSITLRNYNALSQTITSQSIIIGP